MNHLLRLFASVILLSACVAEAATGKWNSKGLIIKKGKKYVIR